MIVESGVGLLLLLLLLLVVVLLILLLILLEMGQWWLWERVLWGVLLSLCLCLRLLTLLHHLDLLLILALLFET